MGRKFGGGLCPFRGWGGGSPSNTVWPGPRPTCMPSFILIRPTVWPQYTNVTDRPDRQRTDSTGRTVLQTVAQKPRSRLLLGEIGSRVSCWENPRLLLGEIGSRKPINCGAQVGATSVGRSVANSQHVRIRKREEKGTIIVDRLSTSTLLASCNDFICFIGEL